VIAASQQRAVALGDLQRVLQQAGNCHWIDAAGCRCNSACNFFCFIEDDIADYSMAIHVLRLGRCAPSDRASSQPSLSAEGYDGKA